MSDRTVIGRWRYPFVASEFAALNDFAQGWCKRTGYGEPFIATDGPHYDPGWLTIVAAPAADLIDGSDDV